MEGNNQHRGPAARANALGRLCHGGPDLDSLCAYLLAERLGQGNQRLGLHSRRRHLPQVDHADVLAVGGTDYRLAWSVMLGQTTATDDKRRSSVPLTSELAGNIGVFADFRKHPERARLTLNSCIDMMIGDATIPFRALFRR